MSAGRNGSYSPARDWPYGELGKFKDTSTSEPWGEIASPNSKPTGKHRELRLASLLALLFLAFLAALAQHLANNYLNGRVVPSSGSLSQSWTSTYNVGFATLFRTLICMSMGIAFIASLWRRLGSHALTLAELDAAFSLQKSLQGFTKFRMIGQIWIPALLAMLIWIVPLTSIKSPASLSVVSSVEHASMSCTLPTINYTVP